MTTALALPDQWRRDVQQYESQQYNVLAPKELGPIPPYHTPRLAVVEVNPDPKAGDCYPLPGGGKLGLSKVALDRISQAAGITWLPELCGRVDDGRDPTIIRYKAVGRIKDLNGQWRTIIGEKEIDLVAIEDELRESVPKRDWIKNLPPDKKPKAIEDAVRSDLIQFRKHRLARAQSGAMNRAIRSALALRSQYTPQEIAKPFVLPKVIFTPDYADPEVKKFMLAEATGHLSELYGAPAVSAALPPALPPAPEDESETEPPSAPAPTNGGGQSPAPDPNLADEAAFQEAYNAEEQATGDDRKKAMSARQARILDGLMARKGFDPAKLKNKVIESWERKHRLEFFQRLIELPDTQQELPWE